MASNRQVPDDYEILRDRILRGELHPMQRLIETELAESLGSNRARIRRALARLEHDGLVVSEPYRGAYVRMMGEEEAVEIFEARGVLEPHLVRQTVARADEADKLRLRSLVEQMQAAFRQGDPMAVGRSSRKIREEMWRIAGNATIEGLLAMLNTRLIRFWYRSVMVPDRAASIRKELEAAVEAICAGSADAASAAMRRYHQDALDSLHKAIQLRAGGGDGDVA